MIEAEAPFVDPIILNNIDELTISKAAKEKRERRDLLVWMQTVGDEFLYQNTLTNMAST